MMEWVIIPLCLLVAAALTWLSGRALREPEESPCEHPWFMDGRCIVCGTPR